MRFIANLRAQTLESFQAHSASLAGCLLSAHRATPAAVQLAHLAGDSGIPVMADNGTKPLIDDVVERFADRAAPLRQTVKEVRRALGHVPRGREVPAALRAAASELAKEVVRAATDVSDAVDHEELLQTQLEMRPAQVIAKEDFATACLLALGLGDRHITGWRIERIDTRNRRSLKLWRRVAEDPRAQDAAVYAVLSATDFNTARSGARLAAAEGVRHAAVGMAGLAKDPSATDFYVIGRRTIRLDPPVPRRYVRLAEILRGFAAGFDESGASLESFHCLGLGAPPLQPVAAASLPGDVFLTSDATSPIHEAVKNRVMYDPSDHGRRASTRNVVERIVTGGGWSFKGPFDTRYKDEFGHDPEASRTWWQSRSEPPITIDLLRETNDLTTALPLFSHADEELEGHTQETRIAHNHWLLDRLTRDLEEGGSRPENARAALDAIASGPPDLVTRGIAAAVRLLDESE